MQNLFTPIFQPINTLNIYLWSVEFYIICKEKRDWYEAALTICFFFSNWGVEPKKSFLMMMIMMTTNKRCRREQIQYLFRFCECNFSINLFWQCFNNATSSLFVLLWQPHACFYRWLGHFCSLLIYFFGCMCEFVKCFSNCSFFLLREIDLKKKFRAHSTLTLKFKSLRKIQISS